MEDFSSVDINPHYNHHDSDAADMGHGGNAQQNSTEVVERYSGHTNEYTNNTLMGNWFEERRNKTKQLQQQNTENNNKYPKHIQSDLLVEYQNKCKVALSEVCLSSANENNNHNNNSNGSIADSDHAVLLKFGDSILLQNAHTQGMLATDIDEELWLKSEYALQATTNTFHTKAVLRNTFVILPAPASSSAQARQQRQRTPPQIGSAIHYGQEFILCTHPKYHKSNAKQKQKQSNDNNEQNKNKQYYLHSEIVSHLCSSNFSRQQLCIFHPNVRSPNIKWKFLYGSHLDRFEMDGQPIVKTKDLTVIMKHILSNSLLASDTIANATDFGSEFQVSCHIFQPNARCATLKKELVGIENDSKGELKQNKWKIIYE